MDTVFYHLKLKKNKTAAEVFSKMHNSIKKKSAAKNWRCTVCADSMTIDFGDEKSETFVLRFDGMTADGFCKVAFPLEGDAFDDDKKSEFKLLIAMFYSVKSYCLEIELSDDYDIANELFDSLDYKMVFRELLSDEKQRLDRLYQLGYTSHEDFLLALFAEELGLPEDFEWINVLNPDIRINFAPFPFISSICETYLYETSLLKKKTLHDIYAANNTGDPPSEVYAFILGVGALFKSYDFILNMQGRGAQVSKFYTDKFLPIFVKADNYLKCEYAYRLMQSIYDYCGFTYVVRKNSEQAVRKKFDSGYKFLSANLKSWEELKI